MEGRPYYGTTPSSTLTDRAWKGEDEVVSFPMMTDCHSRYYALSRNYFGWNDTEAEIMSKAQVQKANLAFEGEPNWDDPKVHALFMDRFLAATIAFGHVGYFMTGKPDEEEQGYWMIQPLAAHYAKADVREILKLAC